MKKSLVKSIRWFARILGSLLVLLVLVMFIGYAIEPQGTGDMTLQDIPLIIGMIAMLIGIIIAWFHEGIGGLFLIGGFIPFLVDELQSGQGYNAWFLAVFPLIGLLHLFCWWVSSKIRSGLF